MPVLSDLLARLVFLAATPSVIGVFVTATVLIVSRDWRLNVIALAAQYFFVALLMTQVIRAEMAAVKALIGWVICLVFYVTEQQAQLRQRAGQRDQVISLRTWFSVRLDGWRREGVSARAVLSLLAVVMVGVAVYASSAAFPLPQLTRQVTLVVHLMATLGILLLGVSEDPLRVGMGLLTFLSGFDLFYVALEPSLLVTGVIGSINFVVALASAYLKAAQAAVRDKEASP